MKKIITLFSLFILVLTACKNNKPNSKKKMKGEPICKYLGIDFSHHQGDANWKTIDTQTKHRASFFIFRAWRQGDRKDTSFQRNFAEAKKRGFIVGGYQFYDPNKDPATQTSNYIVFMDSIKLGKGDFRPIFDVELLSDTLLKVMGTITTLKKDTAQLRILKMIRVDTVDILGNLRDTLRKQFVKNIKTCLSILEAKYGVKPILYANLNFFKENLLESFGFDYPLWIAAYDCDRRSDSVVINSSIVQFSDKIKLPGVKGTVDGNDIDCNKLEGLLLK